MNAPFPYGLANLAFGFVANSRKKRNKVLPMFILRSPWPKSIAKKVEAFSWIVLSPIIILAIHDKCLFRMKFQLALNALQSLGA